MLESLIQFHTAELEASQDVVSSDGNLYSHEDKALAALGCKVHRGFLEQLRAAQRLLPEATRDWKHVKRGSLYAEVGELTVQTETPIEDGATLVLYRDTDLRWWGRPPAEFHDGRFVAEPS